jgi:hypothetical protein
LEFSLAAAESSRTSGRLKPELQRALRPRCVALAQFIEFARQPMTQRALGPQFFQEIFGFGERIVSPRLGKQSPPDSRYF